MNHLEYGEFPPADNGFPLRWEDTYNDEWTASRLPIPAVEFLERRHQPLTATMSTNLCLNYAILRTLPYEIFGGCFYKKHLPGRLRLGHLLR